MKIIKFLFLLLLFKNTDGQIPNVINLFLNKDTFEIKYNLTGSKSIPSTLITKLDSNGNESLDDEWYSNHTNYYSRIKVYKVVGDKKFLIGTQFEGYYTPISSFKDIENINNALSMRNIDSINQYVFQDSVFSVSLNNIDTSMENLDITLQNVYNTILNDGIKFPDIVFAQSILESDKFRSRVSKKYNNFFGMKYSIKRKTSGKKGKYTIYKNWKYSIYDYKLYQNYVINKHNIKTREQYLSYLNKSYSRTRNYARLINKFLKKYKPMVVK